MIKFYKVINSLCAIYWLYLIYDSFINQSINSLRSTAICGSIVTSIWFLDQVFFKNK